MNGENKPGCMPLLIDVVSWNANNFYVKCPYCEEIHRHGRNSYRRGFRGSHCGNLRSYEYTFPFDEDTQQVAYGIDKSRHRFINTCTLEDLDEGSDEDEQLAGEFSSKAKISDKGSEETPDGEIDMYEAAQEMGTIPVPGEEGIEQKRILAANGECVNGNVSWVRNYLQESQDAQVFLHGRGQYGNTTLISASMERTPEMVSLLLQHGVNVNAINHDGRSTLMEAALWGRLGNARLLLNQGADKNLKDFIKRRTTADLAQPTRRNQAERHMRAGGDDPPGLSCTEDTFRRDADRKEILRLLGHSTDKRKTDLGAPAKEFKDCSFSRLPIGQSVIFRGSIAHNNVTSLYKAVARLERGGQFPTITAMSGWSPHTPDPYLNGKVWTKEVFRLSDEVGHKLTPEPSLDQGVPGQYKASYAEKQLIAYYQSTCFLAF